MTPVQKELARHALGLPNRMRRSYRNHFVTSAPAEDHAQWMAMVEAGLARRHKPSVLTGGEDCFSLTAAGAKDALEPRESLDREDFPA